MASCQACGATRQANGEDLLECAGGCNAFYCSKTCQEKNWESHKLECKTYQSHTCWICKKSGQKGNPVYRSCACRGDQGFGHLHCFVDYAKGRFASYQSCHMCKENYRNEIQRVLAEQMNQEATTMEEALMAKYALAGSHMQSDNLEAGYKCIKEMIETSLHVVGEDHALTSRVLATAVITLAGIATELGHREEAFGWLNCVDRGVQNGTIETIERSLVDVGLVQSFAGLYSSLGQCDRALPYAERSVQMYERYEIVGDTPNKHTPNKLKAKQTVAGIYSDLGRLDKAVTIHKEICKEAKKKLGSSHPATKGAKQFLAVLEDNWAGVEPFYVQAAMTASKGRAITIGFCHGIANRNDLNGIPVEIRLFSREKRKYLVRMTRGDGSQLYVKPSNIIFNPHTSVYVHGLQNANQYNGKLGLTKDYSDNNGRYTVELNHTKKLVTVKPENLLAQNQPDLVFDSTRTLAQMLSHPYACY